MKTKASQILELSEDILELSGSAPDYKKAAVIRWAAHEVRIQAQKIISALEAT